MYNKTQNDCSTIHSIKNNNNNNNNKETKKEKEKVNQKNL